MPSTPTTVTQARPSVQLFLAGRWLPSLIILSLWAVPVSAEPTGKAPTVQKTTDTFVSGGQSIKVWRYQSPAAGKLPAILLLHGIEGPEGHTNVYDVLAQRLAAQGYIIHLVHYFDRTGTRQPELKTIDDQFRRHVQGTATVEEQRALRVVFHSWMSAIRDAVAYSRKQPGVDGARMGLLGLSLGGFLALSVAAQEDLGLAAVVELFGGLPQEVRTEIRRLPPTLVLHGDKDQVVPVREAHALRDLFTTKDLSGTVHIYKGVGHLFVDQKRFDWAAALDAERRTTAFLKEHLQRAQVVQVAQ